MCDKRDATFMVAAKAPSSHNSLYTENSIYSVFFRHSIFAHPCLKLMKMGINSHFMCVGNPGWPLMCRRRIKHYNDSILLSIWFVF